LILLVTPAEKAPGNDLKNLAYPKPPTGPLVRQKEFPKLPNNTARESAASGARVA
jgi:hypothetical protein